MLQAPSSPQVKGTKAVSSLALFIVRCHTIPNLEGCKNEEQYACNVSRACHAPGSRVLLLRGSWSPFAPLIEDVDSLSSIFSSSVRSGFASAPWIQSPSVCVGPVSALSHPRVHRLMKVLIILPLYFQHPHLQQDRYPGVLFDYVAPHAKGF